MLFIFELFALKISKLREALFACLLCKRRAHGGSRRAADSAEGGRRPASPLAALVSLASGDCLRKLFVYKWTLRALWLFGIITRLGEQSLTSLAFSRSDAIPTVASALHRFFVNWY